MKDNYPHLPPQQVINIHDAATLLQTWTGDTIPWAALFDQNGILQLYRGKNEEKLPFYNLSRHGNVCEFKNRSGIHTFLPKADCHNVAVFRRLFTISPQKGLAFNPLRTLTLSILPGLDYIISIFNDGSCYLSTKEEGVTIIGQWNFRYQSLHLWNVNKDIPYGMVADEVPSNTTEKDTKAIMDIILQYAKAPTETIFF